MADGSGANRENEDKPALVKLNIKHGTYAKNMTSSRREHLSFSLNSCGIFTWMAFMSLRQLVHLTLGVKDQLICVVLSISCKCS